MPPSSGQPTLKIDLASPFSFPYPLASAFLSLSAKHLFGYKTHNMKNAMPFLKKRSNPMNPIKPNSNFFPPNNYQAQTAQLLYQGYTCEKIGKPLGFKSKAKVSNFLQKSTKTKPFERPCRNGSLAKTAKRTTKPEKKC